MAEQKTEETKPAVPRRAARPFIGPVGAPGARPLAKPAVQGERPRPAAFSSPLAAERQTLGIAPTGTLPAPDPAAAVVPVTANPSTASSAPSAAEIGDIGSAVPGFDGDATGPVAEIVTPDAGMFASGEPASYTRPVTSEMVALDAFDAFDAVWDAPVSPDAQDAEATASPTDEIALGTDAQSSWGDDITTPPDAASRFSDDSGSDAPYAAPPGGSWLEEVPTATAASTPSSEMPVWLADDADQSTSVAAEPMGELATPAADTDLAATAAEPSAHWTNTEADASATLEAQEDAGSAQWPDPLLAEYAPYIPTPTGLSTVATSPQPDASAEPIDALDNELAYEPQALARLVDVQAGSSSDQAETEIAARELAPQLDIAAPGIRTTDDPPARVSATLDRLAERVRRGEIDVSSVAAEAPDAAVLASVLAALLGGSSSR